MTNIKVNRGLGGLGKGGRRQRHLWSDAGNRLKRREMIHSHRQRFSTSNDKCQFSIEYLFRVGGRRQRHLWSDGGEKMKLRGC